MDNILPLTSLPPDDEKSSLYTYLGRQVFKAGKKNLAFRPLYVYDAVRMRPTFVFGNAWNFIQNLALKDLGAGRTVVIIDAAFQPQILDQLYYWCAHQLQRPFYALIPKQDDQSHTWNPFYSSRLKGNALSEAFFHSYVHYSGKKIDEDDLDFYKETLGLILRMFQEEEMTCNSKDIIQILTKKEEFEKLKNLLQKESAQEYYEDFMHLREFEDDFEDRLKPFLDFLELYGSWIFNSYNPSIRLGKIIHDNAILYIGLSLPKDMKERSFFSSVGNLLAHQIKAHVDELETGDRERRRSVSLILNRAENFLDQSLLNWIQATRASNLLMTCAVSDWNQLQTDHPKFVEQFQNESPNIAFYNPHDSTTSSWFADMWKNKRGDDGFESDEDSVWHEKISGMADGFYLFETPYNEQHPMMVAGPHIPLPPTRPDLKYYRQHYTIAERANYRTMHSEIAPSPEPSSKPPDDDEEEEEENSKIPPPPPSSELPPEPPSPPPVTEGEEEE